MSYFTFNAITQPIASQEGMDHAVLQSISNHAQSTKNDRSRMDNHERGGCWSDELIGNAGSRDWTLKRAKVTPQTLSLAKQFYEDALQWLIKDEHAQSVQVDVWQENPNQIGRYVLITLVDGTQLKVTP